MLLLDDKKALVRSHSSWRRKAIAQFLLDWISPELKDTLRSPLLLTDSLKLLTNLWKKFLPSTQKDINNLQQRLGSFQMRDQETPSDCIQRFQTLIKQCEWFKIEGLAEVNLVTLLLDGMRNRDS
jgi:hypothetical protein